MADSSIFGVSATDFSSGLGAAGALAGGIGTYIADEYKSEGYEQESKAYTQAAGYAAGNVQLSEEGTAIKAYQTQRAVNQAIAKQEAGVAGAGFANSGSAQYLLRSSLSQGALAGGLVDVQGAAQKEGYLAQQAADLNLAKQARTSAEAASVAGDIGLVGGLIGAAAKIVPLIP